MSVKMILRKEGYFPALLCDLCGEEITGERHGVAVFDTQRVGKDPLPVVVPCVHLHGIDCHNRWEAAAKRNTPEAFFSWETLAVHLPNLLWNVTGQEVEGRDPHGPFGAVTADPGGRG